MTISILSPQLRRVARLASLPLAGLSFAFAIAAQANPVLRSARPCRTESVRELFDAIPELPGQSSAQPRIFIPADPVNLIVIGSRQELISTFQKAGWLDTDPITKTTIVRTINTNLRDLPYPRQPMSDLYLFGRRQDLAVQLPSRTARIRHHARFWDSGLVLPQGRVWLGTSTYDIGLWINLQRRLFTHRIEPRIDEERDFIVRDLLRYSACASLQNYVTLPGHIRFSRNWQGQAFISDGQAAVILLP